MKLTEIIDKVKEQQEYMGFTYSVDYIRDLVLAAHMELSEVLNELPWKPWKPAEAQNYNPEAAAKEVVDVIIFCLDIIISLKQEDNIENLVGETLKKIDLRLQGGNYGSGIKRS